MSFSLIETKKGRYRNLKPPPSLEALASSADNKSMLVVRRGKGPANKEGKGSQVALMPVCDQRSPKN